MGATAPATLPPAQDFDLDLASEARVFFRQRIGIIAVGLGLGSAFIGIGLYEFLLFAASLAPVDVVVSALLIVLGGTIILLSLRSGLLNPVRGLKGDSTGLTLARRWRGPAHWQWSDPSLTLEVEDLTPDPASNPEEKRHMFFSGPGPVYGSLAPSQLGPLLDAVRARGLAVRIANREVRSGRTYHQIRRIRISVPRKK
jgi:hypothetical protein